MMRAQEKIIRSWRKAIGNLVRKYKNEIDAWDYALDRGRLDEARDGDDIRETALVFGVQAERVRDQLGEFLKHEEIDDDEAAYLSEAIHLLQGTVAFMDEAKRSSDVEDAFEALADGVRAMRRAWDKMAVSTSLPDTPAERERRLAEEAAMSANPSDWPRLAMTENKRRRRRARERARSHG